MVVRSKGGEKCGLAMTTGEEAKTPTARRMAWGLVSGGAGLLDLGNQNVLKNVRGPVFLGNPLECAGALGVYNRRRRGCSMVDKQLGPRGDWDVCDRVEGGDMEEETEAANEGRCNRNANWVVKRRGRVKKKSKKKTGEWEGNEEWSRRRRRGWRVRVGSRRLEWDQKIRRDETKQTERD
ncbi:hypothetical protein BU24DRAFT_67629 [Aaosphaeria arxii CBS 175.79]|uniref:Uncharacterized protein n=1 Tax=Aaosphaeria arxii CBS 175.79 TaxID=1450172 RepID=A0A6A5XAG1_9PLEO|nr:uncharacterized protein BU24DRAFT_67629 [Aaosphaeria arxii CBS 175.79]KAF2009931.1 hypothetical protein BU24DRAFT_67629 [Aaosphaeria arxii CBS 175.79]